MSAFTTATRVLTGLYRIWDIATILFGIVIAAKLILPEFRSSGIHDFLIIRLQLRQDVLLAFLLFTWGMVFHSLGLYSRGSIANLRTNLWALVIANTIGATLLIAFAILFGIQGVNFGFAVVVGAIATTCGILPRGITALLLERRAKNPENWSSFLIVGTNQRALRLAQLLRGDLVQPRRFIGFADTRCNAPYANDEEVSKDHFLDLTELPDYLRHSPVDDVIVCLPLKTYYDETMDIIACCEEQGITVHVLADLFKSRMTHSRIRYLADQSLITVASHEMHGLPALVKRAMDVVFAGTLLVLLSPIFAAAALAVSITSHGPILFSQERVGLNKKRFRVYKFRTMTADAESRLAAVEALNEANGPAFKIQNDPRVTSVGKFLRKFSIDELPQLINVLRGEMSLVGPRPLALRDYAGFEEDWHRRRHSVRPGITGLWQASDRRHSSFEQWMKLDMQYIDQWRIWLDIKILALTILVVLRGSGQ